MNIAQLKTKITAADILSWKMVIGAGETRTLSVSYSISHPKDQAVFERYT